MREQKIKDSSFLIGAKIIIFPLYSNDNCEKSGSFRRSEGQFDENKSKVMGSMPVKLRIFEVRRHGKIFGCAFVSLF